MRTPKRRLVFALLSALMLVAVTATSVSAVPVLPPTIITAFSTASVPLNGSTALELEIENPNATADLTGIGVTDTLPAGLTVATGFFGGCGLDGSVTATAPNSIVVSGWSLPARSSCFFSLSVTGTSEGVKTNTTGAVTSTEGGTGLTASASILVGVPPTISKSFGAATILVGGSTSLTFTINNANTTVALTSVAFTDTLPAGLVVATPNSLSSTCGGTATATAGSSSVSLSGASLAATASCTVSVNVLGTSGGVKNNSVQVTATESGPGNTSNATLTVVAPPTISKTFSPTSIPLDGTTIVTFTVSNPNATVDLTGITFTDTLPAGLVLVDLSVTCAATISGTATTFTISGATVPASGSCFFTGVVRGTTAGVKNNATGAVGSTNGGTGTVSNTATVAVVAPPAIAKSFSPTEIPINGTSSLSFTISNPNPTVALAGVAFTDSLPAGLVVATPNGLTSTCGGTATAIAGSGSVILSGASLAASASCTVSVNVQGLSASVNNNSVTVTSTNGGTGNTSNASLTVVGPPTIAKSFSPSSISVNGSSTLSFTISNPNTTVALTGVGFTDNLPAGLVISTPNGRTGSCGGGTISAPAGGSTISLAGATLAASASCTFSVKVTGQSAGVTENTTDPVTSTNGGDGNAASATLTVLAPDLAISKHHSPGTFHVGQPGVYTLHVSNVGGGSTSGSVTVVDTLPLGLPPVSVAGSGWSCAISKIVKATCTRSNSLAAGASYPDITLIVRPTISALGTFINIAQVSDDNDANPANNLTYDPTVTGF